MALYGMLSFMEVTSYDFAFSRRKVLKQKIFLIACIFILVLIGLQLLFRFIMCPVSVSSSSMAPGIEKNSALFIIPLGTSRPDFFNVKSVKRGEIVRVASAFPPEKSFFQKSTRFIVSMLTFRRIRPFYRSESGDEEGLYRLIGLPGDTLYMDDYIAYIKARGSTHFLTEFELSSSDYNVKTDVLPEAWDTSMGAQGKTGELVLKAGEYFVLCDNRVSAFDSRLAGPVSERRITGKAILCYYPFGNIKRLF